MHFSSCFKPKIANIPKEQETTDLNQSSVMMTLLEICEKTDDAYNMQ